MSGTERAGVRMMVITGHSLCLNSRRRRYVYAEARVYVIRAPVPQMHPWPRSEAKKEYVAMDGRLRVLSVKNFPPFIHSSHMD